MTSKAGNPVWAAIEQAELTVRFKVSVNKEYYYKLCLWAAIKNSENYRWFSGEKIGMVCTLV